MQRCLSLRQEENLKYSQATRTSAMINTSDVQALLGQATIEIRVHTRSRKDAIEGVKDNVLHLAIAAPPEDGKANTRIEKYLSKITGKSARIITGFSSPRKRVRLGEMTQ